ncbi:MAG: hypothetical protein Q9165_006314 [Trypethelium subeluteriae]
MSVLTEHIALTRGDFIIPPLSVPIPPGTTIDDLRIRLYTLTTPIRFTGADFERYWPYITNLWTRQYKSNIDSHGVRFELHHCKNSHSAIRTPAVRQHRGEGIRHQPFREVPANCGMKMRLVFSYTGYKNEDDLADWVLISNDSKGTGAHEFHTLDDLDRARRSKRFQDICHQMTAQGYSAPAITRWIRRAYAGQEWCRHIGRMDVKNAGQLWRARHKDVEMKPDVEHDEPLPDDVEGPSWLQSAIDEASHEQIRDAIKKVCQDLPAVQDKLLPLLMRWEPEERSPTPPEEIQGGAFQYTDGSVRIVQPRARRDLVQRVPSMVFGDPAPKVLAFDPRALIPKPPAQTIEGAAVYSPQSQPLPETQPRGTSPTPPQNIAAYSISQQIQASPPPLTPQTVGGGMPGRPPNQPKNYSAGPRVLQPAPPKNGNDSSRIVIHVDSVKPSVQESQAPVTPDPIEDSTRPLFTARPRWAK